MFNGFNYFRSRDKAEIRYAWRAPARGKPSETAVLLGGRAEFIEKHAETVDELADRGFSVYTADWRGQGLSSRLLEDRRRGHIDSFSSYIEDLDFFMRKIVFPEAAGPVVFLAHSMGAHIVLRFLIENSPAILGAVLVSPMLKINTGMMPEFLVRLLLKPAAAAGLRERFIPGAGRYDSERKPFRNNPLTGDQARFLDEKRKIKQNPALAVGGVTYGWLSAAFDSIDALVSDCSVRPPENPILMVGGSEDRVVSVAAMKQVCSMLPDCRFVELNPARHEILRETESIRRRFWSEFDSFVKIV